MVGSRGRGGRVVMVGVKEVGVVGRVMEVKEVGVVG